MGRRLRRFLSTRVLIYALGGGFGHVRRALNVVQAFGSESGDIEWLLICPQRCEHLVPPDISYLGVKEQPREALARLMAETLQSFRPSLVIVDTFPRGVLGELHFPPAQRRVLLSRSVPPAFYGDPEVNKALWEYDEVFWTEPKAYEDWPGVEIEPVVSWSGPYETCSVSTGARVLGLGTSLYQHQETLRLAFEHAFAGPDFEATWVASGSWEPDLFRRFGDYDLIVSAAGYNTFYEVLQAGTAAIFVPQKRRYDDQAGRVRSFLGCEQIRLLSSNLGAAELKRAALEILGRQGERPIFRGGLQLAQALLLEGAAL